MKTLNTLMIVVWVGMILTFANFSGARSLPDQKEFVNSAGIELVRIKPGSFMMGNDKKLPQHLSGPNVDLRFGDYDEAPVRKVTITKGFYISKTEVTIEQYR
ncbi:MAG: SUMF1/EgtB/PvdO family nonheme iron enzyme, partial [Planctomycetota bacterium]